MDERLVPRSENPDLGHPFLLRSSDVGHPPIGSFGRNAAIILQFDLEHFRKWCRPEFYWYPTHSAEKRGMDGARKSTSKAKMLQESRNSHELKQ
jgi:hypothetical protein